jgi:CspA family cold shock protein
MGINIVKEKPTQKGTVKFFKSGWGFITGDDGKDYFAHYSQVNQLGHKDLFEDQKVTFVPENTAKGLSATLISVIE